MKKVLILVNHEIVIYNFRKELVKSLIEAGYQVYLSSPCGEKIEFLKKMGVHYIRTPIDRRGTNLVNDSELLLRYLIIIKRIKPDIVLSYTIKPNIYGGLICRLLKTHFIPNVTGLGTSAGESGILLQVIKKLYRISFKSANCVFFQNESNAGWMKENRIISGKYRLLPGSGVNLNEFGYISYPDGNQTIKFLFLGRIMKDKGIEEFLDAARMIKRVHPDVDFVVAGEREKDYFGNLEQAVQDGIVTYEGFQSDVRGLMKVISAVVVPSYHEGLSNVLLEASACGRPVLASNIPGCREAFDEGVTGLGFEPRSVESLKETLEKFILLPYEKKRLMGIEARRKMERQFDRRIVIDAYLDEINKISAEEKGHEPIRSIN